MLLKSKFLIIWTFCMWSLNQAITVYDNDYEGDDVDIEEFRKPKAQGRTQGRKKRLPAQQISTASTGYVHQNADDVIHIIDPPKHFQDLKKYMQYKNQQRNSPPLREPTSLPQRPKRGQVRPLVRTTSGRFIENDMNSYIYGSPTKTRVKKKLNDFDLYTQETKELPVEILTSVRKTERLIRKNKPKLPKVKQRLSSKQTHTVIWEKGQEQDQYEKGHEKRVQGIRENYINRKRFNRIKRDLKTSREQSRQRSVVYQPLKGEMLLSHINDLLKNAESYLAPYKSEEKNKEYSYKSMEETSTLTGEIFPTKIKPKKYATQTQTYPKYMMQEIFENSFKATNALINHLKTRANITDMPDKCSFQDLNQVQQQLECMQNQMQKLKTKNLKKTSRELKNRNTFLKPKIANDYLESDVDIATASDTINPSLIYTDVMTTIRNMLQSNNLNELEKNLSFTLTQDNGNLSPLSYSTQPQQVNLRDLNQYINSLQNLIVNLPKYFSASNSGQGKLPKYIFQNLNDGIYNVPVTRRNLHNPVVAVYHQYPYMLLRKEYLRNDTASGSTDSSL
uniref:Uncharacterized protein n=1 Tax=Glossina brevipalpis TaxID=37001 RepID=A0A240SWC8_9MUSC